MKSIVRIEKVPSPYKKPKVSVTESPLLCYYFLGILKLKDVYQYGLPDACYSKEISERVRLFLNKYTSAFVCLGRRPIIQSVRATFYSNCCVTHKGSEEAGVW